MYFEKRAIAWWLAWSLHGHGHSYLGLILQDSNTQESSGPFYSIFCNIGKYAIKAKGFTLVLVRLRIKNFLTIENKIAPFKLNHKNFANFILVFAIFSK